MRRLVFGGDLVFNQGYGPPVREVAPFLDAYVAELTSFSDLFAGVAKDTMKPLNERMSAVGTLMQNGVAR